MTVPPSHAVEGVGTSRVDSFQFYGENIGAYSGQGDRVPLSDRATVETTSRSHRPRPCVKGSARNFGRKIDGVFLPVLGWTEAPLKLVDPVLLLGPVLECCEPLWLPIRSNRSHFWFVKWWSAKKKAPEWLRLASRAAAALLAALHAMGHGVKSTVDLGM